MRKTLRYLYKGDNPERFFLHYLLHMLSGMEAGSEKEV